MAFADTDKETSEGAEAKLARLQRIIGSYGSVAVAFSAGIDSTLLLKVAHDVLGDAAIAVSTTSPSIPARETEEARAFCRNEGIRHIVVETGEFSLPGFRGNPPERCYLCKREMLACIRAAARAEGVETVAEGSNADDDADDRPGWRAVCEAGVRSPLREAGLAKADVRALARKLGITAWDKPAYACLNTRFRYGETLTDEKLALVERAEYLLHDEGFPQVRVRYEAGSARIEVATEDLARLIEADEGTRITERIRQLGFTEACIDPRGYRRGSMGETL